MKEQTGTVGRGFIPGNKPPSRRGVLTPEACLRQGGFEWKARGRGLISGDTHDKPGRNRGWSMSGISDMGNHLHPTQLYFQNLADNYVVNIELNSTE
jgi:hypothetical protein